MNLVLQILFWISLGILFYCYIGYGLMLWLFNNINVLLQKNKPKCSIETPPVTIIIAAYNEADMLEKKIRNTLAIDYPADKLKVVIVTDGSADGSEYIVKRFPEIILMHQAERRGKYAAIKRAMQTVSTPFVVFSDANTMLNPECLKKIMPHYQDENIGGVAGEKKILQNRAESVVGEAEGLYWQYESFLKKMDASFFSIVGAAGELFSIRTHLFSPVDDHVILDDFIISMQVCLQGYRFAYEPDAFATETASDSLIEESKRKIRIAAGAYQSVYILKAGLSVFKYPLLSFQYLSRRLFRWVLCPLSIVLVFAANLLLVIFFNNDLFSSLLFLQTVFYAFAFLGWGYVSAGKKAGIFTIPFYFVFMNFCLVKGFLRFVKGRQSVLWEKSVRSAL
ncbi:MAG TPA: glycosyltransferase family 2 protein [Chitinophagaceae bacterium]|nr:glycosyltransferase family 2 protein [Chitinophagaceae bacterium]